MGKLGWPAQTERLSSFAFIGPLVCCLSISGCATRLYSINMNYDAEGAAIPSYLKAAAKERSSSVTVGDFVDVRKVDDPMIIGRVIEKDGTKTPVMPKYTQPTQAVASGIKRYLVKAGYKVSASSVKWDLKEETIPKADGRFFVGGNINELEITCRKGFPTDSYIADIKLSLVLADTAKGKILYRGSIGSNSSLEHVSFSEARLEEQINNVLKDAIEKVFDDRNMISKLKEAAAE